jgi:PKD repeat protein
MASPFPAVVFETEVVDMRTRSRWATAAFAAFIVLATVAPALASPPANDDFASADVVTSLPFVDVGDLAATTSEPGEPSHACLPTPTQTAWYVFSPSSSGSIKVDLAGSSFPVTAVAYQSAWGGFGGLSLLGCTSATPGSSPLTLAVTAGSTYYFQVGMFVFGPSHVEIRIEAVVPPPHDSFADAEALAGLPVSATTDLTAATLEGGEPAPGGRTIIASAWYSYTPASTGTLLLRTSGDPSSAVGVYTGGSLTSLTEVASGSGSFPVHFLAQAGTTYWIQVARGGFFFGPPVVTITIEQPGSPSANFFYVPSDPSIYDTVQFIDSSFDPAFIGFAPAQWDFGDGTTATGSFPTHRYAADGDYTVTLVATTHDGRTATATQTLAVRTHDVSIERIQAPNSARVGQTKSVTVNVRGGQYAETVVVDLYKSTPGGEQYVGTQTQTLAPARGGRVAGFPFDYTFSADDAAVGKVTFRAVATISGARDALPADNQAIAPPTAVRS